MSANDAIHRFVAAEQHYARSLGIDIRTHYLRVPTVPRPVRLLEAGAGPTVFLLHGGPAFAGVWLPLMAAVHGVRLLAIDRPGYGLTGSFDYHAVDYREFAVTFLDQVFTTLNLSQVPVVASSMGGLWSLWFALEAPERISRMVQLGCPPFVLQSSLPLMFRLLGTPFLNRLLLLSERPGSVQVRKVFTRMGHSEASVNRWPDEFWNLGLAFERLPEYRRGWLRELEAVAWQQHRQPRMVLNDCDLARISQPTLFLWGARDNIGGPELGRQVTGAMPNAQLHAMDGGHLPWLDDPSDCGERIAAFLRPENAGPDFRHSTSTALARTMPLSRE